MGLIKNIFGKIFGLFGSIFKAIGGLVGLGKKSEFYLELDEAQEGGQKPDKAPETDQSAAAPAQSASTSSAESPAPTASQKPVAEEASAKNGGSPAPAAAPVAAAPPAAKQSAPKPEPVGNFATDYLVNPKLVTNKRRRPGPSLSPFKDLAREMNVPMK